MATPLLRLTQTGLGEGRHRVEASLEIPGRPRQTATVQFAFTLTPQEQEDVRWYLEDGSPKICGVACNTVYGSGIFAVITGTTANHSVFRTTIVLIPHLVGVIHGTETVRLGNVEDFVRLQA